MQLRCAPYQLVSNAKLTAGLPLKPLLQSRTEWRNRRIFNARSSRPLCSAPRAADQVPGLADFDTETKQNHSTEGFQSTESRKFSSDSGLLRSLGGETSWIGISPRNVHGVMRHMSTSSSTTERSAGVSHSVRETTPGHTIATISLANPTKMNIVNSSILAELVETCRELSKDDSLRAVVLTGGATAEGRAASFMGGADIKEMNALSSSQAAKAFINRIHAACQALRDLPVPVIARVNGFSLGAGLEIMAACDMRIATKDSTFGMPEVKVGIPSVVEAALLPGLIGMGRTRRLLYLAENISAREALEWGLVEKVVDDEATLDQTVSEWADMIAGMGPKSIRIQKALMQSWENTTVAEGVQAGVEAFGKAFSDGGREPKEFMAKFINRKR